MAKVAPLMNQQWKRYNQVHASIVGIWHLKIPQLYSNPIREIVPVYVEFTWWR